MEVILLQGTYWGGKAVFNRTDTALASSTFHLACMKGIIIAMREPVSYF